MSKIIARWDGSIPLNNNQKPCESIYEYRIKKEKEISAKFKGDDSIGISGSISIKDKDSAIMFVNGIIDQFDINRDELDI